MARLIDADAILGVLKHRVKGNEDSGIVIGTNSTLAIVEELVQSIPVADAVPVVHGYWHIDDYDGGEPDGYAAFIEVHCSKCGYELGAESGQYGWDYGDPFPLNYCPNCGATMDLEVE